MANKHLPDKQQQAITIRKYLQSDETKSQVRMAIPKFMNAERLLRVAYTSVTRNPKLLECSVESLLSAIIQCAQLGLEPILGRAHLVPYWNDKKKCLEAQFQPGYQGLVDLCRRTGEIADVWAEVIKEKDEWDIEFGLERHLTHKPNFEVEDRGRPIGAYAVFQHKDGTKGWSYLPISMIYSQHRAKSQAYLNAIKKKIDDTPWISDEDEMIKKTMLKHQAKTEPVSIEVQAAVAMDTAVEMGRSSREAWNAFIAATREDEDVIELPDSEKAAQFDELVKDLPNNEKMNEFVQHCATHFDTTIEEVKAQAVQAWDEFTQGYNKWAEKQKPEKILCPWPDCRYLCKSQQGLRKHLTQQHGGKEPRDEPEPSDPPPDTEPEESTTTEPKSEPEGAKSGDMEPDVPVACYKCGRTMAYKDAIEYPHEGEILYWCGMEDCR
jgi:recombination protein RecT